MIKKIAFSLILLLNSFFVFSQEEQVADSTKNNETIGFESYYYSALNEKIKGNYAQAVDLLHLALRYKPFNADAQYELSINYKSLKDYKRAILFGENAIRFNPGKKWFWINVAELYTLTGDIENAERCFKKLAGDDPKFIPQFINALSRNGHNDEALRQIDFFLENTRTEDLLVIKRDLLVVNEQLNEAIELTGELININPANLPYYFDISELLILNKDYKKAKKYIEEGLNISPENNLLVRQNFKLLMEQEKFDDAFIVLNDAFENEKLDFTEKIGFVVDFIEFDSEHRKTGDLIKALDKWLNNSEDLRIYPIIGNLYKVQRRDDLALEYFRSGFKKGYSEYSVLIEMLVIEQELGRYDLLYSDADKMLTLFPAQPIIYLFKGFAASQMQMSQEAVNAYEAGLLYVVNNDKLKAEFYGQIADVYYRNKNIEEAFDNFDQALKFDPENVLVLNNYAYYLAVNNGDLDLALKLITQVVEAEPLNPTYLDTLAWVYYKRGDYEKARSAIEEALKNEKLSNAELFEHYGDILFKLNEVKLAVKNWKKAQKLIGSKADSTLINKIERESLLD